MLFHCSQGLYLFVFFFPTRQFTWKQRRKKIPNQQTRRMSPVSIETPEKHHDHVSCTQEAYSYRNGWCSRTLSILTICHYLSLQEAQGESLMTSRTDLYKWFLDSLHHSGLSKTPNPNLQTDFSTAIQMKPRPSSPERTQMLCVLQKLLRLPRVRNCLQEAPSYHSARAQVLLFTSPSAAAIHWRR